MSIITKGYGGRGAITKGYGFLTTVIYFLLVIFKSILQKLLYKRSTRVYIIDKSSFINRLFETLSETTTTLSVLSIRQTTFSAKTKIIRLLQSVKLLKKDFEVLSLLREDIISSSIITKSFRG